MSEPAYQSRVDEGQLRFRLTLLGTPGLADSASARVPGLGPGKPLAMLAYLAVRRQVRREELLALLWGDAPEGNARNAFRQALHRLRAALGDEIVPHDPDHVGLTPGDAVEIDRDTFLAACDSHRWLDAIELYHGDFLEGLEFGEPAFDRWAEGERTRLRSRYLAALRAAAEGARVKGNWNEALEHAQALSALSTFEEEAALLEATILVEAGRNTEALATLRRFVARIHEELDLPTPPAVRDLINKLERLHSRQSPASSATIDAPHEATRKLAFVGREAELGKLMPLIRALQAEHGATVVIDGEAGIGKTRLMDELLIRSQALGPLRVLRGHEPAVGASLPYASIAEALRGLLNAPGVAGTSRHLLAEASRILPELRDSFELAAPGPIEDEGGRLRFFEGVAALIDAAAYEEPVAIVIDDLHHASASTLDLLSYLCDRLRHSPVLFILIFRRDSSSAYLAQRLAALAGKAGLDVDGAASVHMSLEPLSAADIESLVVSYIAPRELEPAVLARVVELARGRPFAAAELVRRALEGGIPPELPARLRDALWARLQACSPSERRVFFAAALLQRSASLRLLAAAAHLPEAATLDAAIRLEQVGLLSPVGSGYVLSHDVTGTFVVEMSGVAGRALLGGWAADALAHEHDATDAELAHLYSLSGRGQPAFTHARVAAYGAAAAGATDEAVRLFNVALTFAPDERTRAEVAAALVALGGGAYPLLPSPDAPPVEEAEATIVEAEPQSTPATPGPATPSPSVPSPPQSAPPIQRGVARTAWRDRRSMIGWIAFVAVLLIGVVVLTKRQTAAGNTRPLADSLLVAEHTANRSLTLRLISGPIGQATVSDAPRDAARPTWVDSLLLPWINPLMAPNGQVLTVERMTPAGTDLYLMPANRRDTTALAVGGGDDIALGWSPDSRAVLVSRARTLPDGSFDSDLYAYHIGEPIPVPIDTTSRRAIAEAAWSPDGSSVAWVARTGPDRQQDVFVSRADGSGVRNVSASPADDYHVAWAPDGASLAFTSNRGGATHLYVYDLVMDRLDPVQTGPGPDDHAVFSPDGRYIAFESTRDGDAAVYAITRAGGALTRLTPPGRQFSVIGWHPRPPYIDRVRIVGSSTASLGDTARFNLLGIDQAGFPMVFRGPRWTVVDSTVLRASGEPRTSNVLSTAGFSAVPVSSGTARLVVSLPGWRADTLAISVGVQQRVIVDDGFSTVISPARWLALGSPRPLIRAAPGDSTRMALHPNADLEWESGVLSRAVINLNQPLALQARVYAPFDGGSRPATTLNLSLVAAVDDSTINVTAPQFFPLVSLGWNGESGRLVYTVGRESFNEAASALGTAASHAVRINIAADGAVAFLVDGSVRWRSSLRFIGDIADVRARLWIGGRATGSSAAVSDVRIERPPDRD